MMPRHHTVLQIRIYSYNYTNPMYGKLSLCRRKKSQEISKQVVAAANKLHKKLLSATPHVVYVVAYLTHSASRALQISLRTYCVLQSGSKKKTQIEV